MDISNVKQVKPVAQVTQDHINVMQGLLDNNQRAEVYMYYSKLIGNNDPSAVNQLMMQAQITTYSGIIGGAALMGNFNAKKNAPDLYNLTLDDFSKDIIQGMIKAIETDISPEEGGTGLLTANDIQAADKGVWSKDCNSISQK